MDSSAVPAARPCSTSDAGVSQIATGRDARVGHAGQATPGDLPVEVVHAGRTATRPSLAAAVERQGHGRDPGVTELEQVLGGLAHPAAVVDADGGHVRRPCWPSTSTVGVPRRRRAPSIGSSVVPPHMMHGDVHGGGLEQRVDRRAARVARPGDEQDAEVERAEGADQAVEHLDRDRVAERPAQRVADDDADDPGPAPAQLATEGVGPGVVERGGGVEHPLTGRRGDRAGAGERERGGRHRDVRGGGDVGQGGALRRQGRTSGSASRDPGERDARAARTGLTQRPAYPQNDDVPQIDSTMSDGARSNRFDTKPEPMEPSPCATPPPAVSRARWLLMGLFALTGITFSSWLARIPTVRDLLDLSTSELGLMLLIGSVGALLTVTVSGVIVQRFGSRVGIIASTGVLAVGLVLMGVGPTVGSVAAARRRHLPQRRRGRARQRAAQRRVRPHRARDGPHRHPAVPRGVLDRGRHGLGARRASRRTSASRSRCSSRRSPCSPWSGGWRPCAVSSCRTPRATGRAPRAGRVAGTVTVGRRRRDRHRRSTPGASPARC